MNVSKLQGFFERRRDRGDPLVLATVYETSGSTYSKPGVRMLIDENGIFQGMLSGGCLEGDLGIRARIVVESGQPQTVTYDLASDNDELWGMGVGCDGMMRVFLQPVTVANDYEPLASILACYTGRERAVSATVIESAAEGLQAGATLVFAGSDTNNAGWPEEALASVVPQVDAARSSGESGLVDIDVNGATASVLLAAIDAVPRLLVLGAGLDAEPLLRFADELGWKVTIADHRPAYIDNNDFAGAELRVCCPAAELAGNVELDSFDLAVVMSHHLASDRSYLEQLSACRIPYVGVLGPPGRRDRLLGELGDAADALRDRVHGPAGLDLGGRGPAVIALSIIAEMQSALPRG